MAKSKFVQELFGGKTPNLSIEDVVDVDAEELARANTALVNPVSETVATIKKQREEEILEQARNLPGASPAVRAGLSIKMPEGEGRINFLRKIFGERNVAESERGFLFRKGESAPWQFVDPPADLLGGIGQVALLAAGGLGTPAGLPGAYEAIRAVSPETAGDIADWAGEGVETIPSIVIGALTRGKGAAKATGAPAKGKEVAKAIGRDVGIEAGGDVLGSTLRQLVSAALPGEETITAKERAISGGVNVLGGLAGEGVTRGIGAGTGELRRRLGERMLFGPATSEAGKRGVALGERTGVEGLTPAMTSLDPDAIAYEGFIRQHPGARKFWAEGDEKRLLALGKSAEDAIAKAGGPDIGAAEATGRVKLVVTAYENELDSARKKMFGEAMGVVDKITGGKPIFRMDALAETIDDLADRGVNTDPLVKALRGVRDVNGKLQINLTGRQLQDTLAKYKSGGAMLHSDREFADFANSKIRQGLLADLDRYADVPKTQAIPSAMGTMSGETPLEIKQAAANAIKYARNTYREMSKPLDDIKIKMVRGLLNRPVEDLSKVPSELIAPNGPSPEAITKLITVLEANDPATARAIRGAALREALVHATPAEATVASARAGAERAVGEEPKRILSASKLAAFGSVDRNRRIKALFGADKEGYSAWLDIMDVARRIGAVQAEGTGSQTWRLKWLESIPMKLSSIVTAPKESMRAFVDLFNARDLSAIANDPIKRNEMLKIIKPKPNQTAQQTTKLITHLTALVARDRETEE